VYSCTSIPAFVLLSILLYFSKMSRKAGHRMHPDRCPFAPRGERERPRCYRM
jgi:hypothetical protein